MTVIPLVDIGRRIAVSFHGSGRAAANGCRALALDLLSPRVDGGSRSGLHQGEAATPSEKYRKLRFLPKVDVPNASSSPQGKPVRDAILITRVVRETILMVNRRFHIGGAQCRH